MQITANGKRLPFLSRQMLLAMKLLMILTVAAVFSVRASVTAQTVTLKTSNSSLEKVLREVKKQTGYDYYLNAKLVGLSKPISIESEKQALAEFLAACLKDQPLTFEIVEKSIIIMGKKGSSLAEGLNPGLLPNENEAPPSTVRGRITNEKGEPIAGISIAIKGGRTIGISNDNGEFILTNIPDNASLVFSAVSIETYELRIVGNKELLLTVKTKISTLDEIQVIAYGQTSKRLNTGNISTINQEDIEKQPISNAILALQGRVTGIAINQMTGLNGGAVTTLIDGKNSLVRGSDPFYVVDGVPYVSVLPPNIALIFGTGNTGSSGSLGNGSPLNYLNPSDIESISVLKDADATSIYGSRAANGAIIITTRKGKAGQSRVDLSVQNGWGNNTRRLPLLGLKQYLEMRREAFKNDNIAMTTANAYDLTLFDTTRSTDWQNLLIGGTAQYTNLDASVSGGTRNVQYLISGTYNRQTTVFPASFPDVKGSLHFNLNTLSENGRFKTSISAMYMNDNNSNPSTDLTARAISIGATSPYPIAADGSYDWGVDATGTSRFTNPLATFNNIYKNRTKNLVSSLQLSYLFSKFLELSTNLGYTTMDIDEISTSPLSSVRPDLRATTARGSGFVYSSLSSWSVEPQLTYRSSVGALKIEAIAGGSLQRLKSETARFGASGFNNDAVLEDIKSASTVTVAQTNGFLYKYAGLFSRINLNFRNKYIVNLSARRDGSSRFGPNNRYNNFGAIGGAWVFSEENLFKKFKFLSFGKLRGSYGTTGNDQIGEYIFLDLYNAVSTGVAYQGAVGYQSARLANPDIQWEGTKKFAVGLDLGLYSDRVIFGAGFYRNVSSNQLLGNPQPSTTGFTSITENFQASIVNSGWEFTLHTLNIKKPQFLWSSDINITLPRSELLAYEDLANSSNASTYVIGGPVTIRRLYSFAGTDPSTGQFRFLDSKGIFTVNPTFPADLTANINTAPTITGGLSNSFTYKGFQLDVLIQVVKQTGTNYYFGNSPGSTNFNQPVWVMDRWQKAGDVSDHGRFTTNSGNTGFQNLSQSDANNNDASYARVKNASLSWTIPDKWRTRIKLRDARIFIHGQNLFTITNYKGLDPETRSTQVLPPLRVITVGFRAGL
jgi:TonB-linked SusC/RagA family outer membrane protein